MAGQMEKYFRGVERSEDGKYIVVLAYPVSDLPSVLKFLNTFSIQLTEAQNGAAAAPPPKPAPAQAAPPAADSEEEIEDDDEDEDEEEEEDAEPKPAKGSGKIQLNDTITKATRLREIVAELMKQGMTDEKDIIAWCKAHKKQVPTLGSVDNIDGRVPKSMATLRAIGPQQ